MKYKMIITDLDDTLLDSNGLVSSENKMAIIRAQKMGVKFVLASGRPTFAMKHIARVLELDKYGSYILSYNGSIVSTADNFTEIFSQGLSKDDIHELYDFSRKNNVDIITYLGDTIISEDFSEYINVEVTLLKMDFEKVGNFKLRVNSSSPKCIMLQEPTYLKKIEEVLIKEYGYKYSICTSKPFFLEITRKDVDKGKTLLRLAKDLNISPDEIIAVGDSYNDLTMLQVVGLPVAVENAKPELKEIAKFITTSHEEHALKTVIDKFIM